jgi:hypothetical protein
MSRMVLGAFISFLVGACTAEDPTIREYQTEPDASVAEALEAPSLVATVPTRTPLASVALRGKAGGSRIVVSGGASGSLVRLPLPSGDFCVDVPLSPGATTTITIYTLDAGFVSDATVHTVVHDPAAVQPDNPYCDPPACNGTCPTTEGDCVDGKDNDLDGWTDDCDLDCSGCVDDAFEPNSFAAAVPLLPYDTAHKLQLCPCHDDWFAVYLQVDTTLTASLSGDDPGFNIDMKLFRAEDAEKGGYKSNTPLGKSTSSGSEEKISWKADKTGMYYLFVYSPDSKQSGAYQLQATASAETE